MSGFVNRADGLIAPTSIDISLNCICFISDVLKTKRIKGRFSDPLLVDTTDVIHSFH